MDSIAARLRKSNVASKGTRQTMRSQGNQLITPESTNTAHSTGNSSSNPPRWPLSLDKDNFSSSSQVSFQSSNTTGSLHAISRVLEVSPNPTRIAHAFHVYVGSGQGGKIALKVPQAVNDESEEQVVERAKKEISIWARLDHPNVVQLLDHCFGSTVPTLGAVPAMMIFPLYQKGHARQYIKSTEPGVDQRLALLSGVSDGLAYLHAQNIVHGDLQPENVLINDMGAPLLTEFTSSRVVDTSTASPIYPSFSRFSAPELVVGESISPKPTKQSDVYSLACITLEFSFGITPYQSIEEYDQVIIAIFEGVQPATKPSEKQIGRIDAEIWNLLKWGWSTNPASRPSSSLFAHDVAVIWKSMTIPDEPIPDLSKEVTKDAVYAEFNGNYSEVFPGTYRGQKVAVKVLRNVWRDVSTTIRKARRERETWWNLIHPNILPLLGYAEGPEFGSYGALISPWCEQGDAIQYLKKFSEVSYLERVRLWRDVSYGLTFLHTRRPAIVHGDLKPGNILVDKQGVAKICDFGLVQQLGAGSTTASPHTGTTRYLSPELLEADGKLLPTMASDIWTLGCVGLELIYLRSPYHDVRNLLVPQVILNQVSPASRPKSVAGLVHLSLLWEYLECCWHQEPRLRPSAPAISRCLEQYGDLIAEDLSSFKDLDTNLE